MKKIALLVFSILMFSMLSGCASRTTARVDPMTDLRAIKTIHVVKIPDETAGISRMIAEDLRGRGYTVTEGVNKPDNVNALVTYVDRWMWDMTMYLAELTITIREPQTDFPLATGNSLNGSLNRKSPQEKVSDVMNSIFKEVKK